MQCRTASYRAHRENGSGKRDPAHRARVGEHLTPPKGYLDLGKTSEARQRRYRRLCDEYMREAGLIADRPSEEMEARFIGCDTWRKQRQSTARESFNAARAGP